MKLKTKQDIFIISVIIVFIAAFIGILYYFEYFDNSNLSLLKIGVLIPVFLFSAIITCIYGLIVGLIDRAYCYIRANCMIKNVEKELKMLDNFSSGPQKYKQIYDRLCFRYNYKKHSKSVITEYALHILKQKIRKYNT